MMTTRPPDEAKMVVTTKSLPEEVLVETVILSESVDIPKSNFYIYIYIYIYISQKKTIL